MQAAPPQKAKTAWIQTEYIDDRGYPICIFLVKCIGVFSGHIIASASYLASKYKMPAHINSRVCRVNLQRFINKISFRSEEEDLGIVGNEVAGSVSEDEGTEVNSKDPIFKSIQDILLINNWAEEKGFSRYILIIGQRILKYVKEGKAEYFVRNNIGSVVINTGLLNKYGQNIHVMYRYYVKTNSYYPYKAMLSKAEYLEEGFSIEDASKELKPVTFIDEGSEVFCADPCMYDMSFAAIQHCVEARRDRFPNSLQNTPDIVIAQTISRELLTGLSICRCDSSYAKPIFKAKEHEIQWVLPLHINTGIGEEPELVMAISKRNGLYGVRTVLPYDAEMKDWIRAGAPYAGLW